MFFVSTILSICRAASTTCLLCFGCYEPLTRRLRDGLSCFCMVLPYHKELTCETRQGRVLRLGCAILGISVAMLVPCLSVPCCSCSCYSMQPGRQSNLSVTRCWQQRALKGGGYPCFLMYCCDQGLAVSRVTLSEQLYVILVLLSPLYGFFTGTSCG